ncbi:DNA-binding MarR family transcriptional regulator [Lipingzhangella halophila]|uniref:DNA-binding MarR family transcriptional regulator n=1 Tax=Lipingzhangella halophila TaxID=1783352 RepID=A0A7W7W6D7_9ACTN|nr:MarR family winged helix-turn-helix transcriptional regulator [Lipingzhangella halophila]MBB4934799.1 DNA-binding MarR family transcriptional regulator [Lipingzhangella halophila]
MSTPNNAGTDTAAGPERARVSSAGPVSHAIFRVARIHKLLAGQLLREVGLYPGQELLMMRLWDEGPQRQADLAAVLDADAPTVTRSVRRLEHAGFVRRSPSPTDRRVTIIEATPASMGLRQSVERIWADLERMTVADMAEDRQEDVLRALGELERNLTASEESRSGDD